MISAYETFDEWVAAIEQAIDDGTLTDPNECDPPLFDGEREITDDELYGVEKRNGK